MLAWASVDSAGVVTDSGCCVAVSVSVSVGVVVEFSDISASLALAIATQRKQIKPASIRVPENLLDDLTRRTSRYETQHRF